MNAEREMPKYQCHKKVWALHIANITAKENPEDGAFVDPFDVGFGRFEVDAEYITKHKPQAGGYYVVYDDGYKSFSPQAAFESGYTRL